MRTPIPKGIVVQIPRMDAAEIEKSSDILCRGTVLKRRALRENLTVDSVISSANFEYIVIESQGMFWCRSKGYINPYRGHSYYTASAPMYFLTGAQCSYTHIHPTCLRTLVPHQSKTWAN